MSDKLAAGGRYNRISPSSGRGSIIAYSPLPKSEQDCLQAPGNNCLAIPLSAIQTDNNNHQKAMPPMPSLGVVGGGGKGAVISAGSNYGHGNHADGTTAGHKHAGQNHNNHNNNGNVELVIE